uniref:IQ motif and SEC7 domain-containing protein 1 isoform X3 n=1 Tax=Panthera onca TaxID=9690 RepID=UPI0029534909|nr:IQ motif and SEC7 domain-containing protein 1 isoform X3 [Panthera onca]
MTHAGHCIGPGRAEEAHLRGPQRRPLGPARPCCVLQETPTQGTGPSVEGEAPSSETGTSLDSPSAYQGPLAPGSSLSPDHYEHTSVGAYGLYAGPPGQQQRTRRPKLQHSTSILRKQAEEEAIKRSRSLSESYELSSDLQDKQVGGTHHAGTGSQAALPGGRRAALCWDCLGQQESRLSDTGVLRSPTDGSMVMRTCATTVTFASAQAALPAPPDPWRLSE